MERPILKIYGERNTGTNYLSRLIELNFNVNSLPGVVPRSIWLLQKMLPGKEFVRDLYFAWTYPKNLGWKHTLVKSDNELREYGVHSKGVSFVTLTKNPYSWLLSLYNRPYHQNFEERVDFATFVTSPWKTINRENCNGQVLDPVELWNKKNLSYLSLGQSFPTLNIKFENLLATPEQVMRLIGKTFSFSWRVDKFKNYEKSTKGEDKDSEFYRDYYLNNRWKDKLSLEALEIINSKLDDHVVKYFGYEKLSE